MTAPAAFEQQLLDAAPDARPRLIRRRPRCVGEAEVNALAERARAVASANPAEASRIAGVAWELAEALDSARGRAWALRARAAALRWQGRWAESVEAFYAGAQSARDAGDLVLAAQVPIAAPEALAQLGRYDEALQLACSLESSLRALGAEEDAAKVVANAGNIHFERERFAQALDCYERGLAYFEAHGQQIPVARLRMNIANVLTQLGQFEDSLRTYRSAQADLEKGGMEILAAAVDGNVGFLQSAAGRYTEALRAYARARQRFEALELPKDVAKCDREVADVYLNLNLIPEAHEAYERVLPVFTEMQMAAEAARAGMGLAAALAAQGRMPAALEALARAEQAFGAEKNEVGVARARLQRSEWRLANGKDPEASHVTDAIESARWEARAALNTFRRHGMRLAELQSRLRLAELRVEAGGRSQRALRQLAREARDGAFLTLFWRIEAARARACQNAGKPRGAVAHYRSAVEAVEGARTLLRGDDFRIAFLQDKMRLYEELLALLLERGTSAALREAFQVAERAKSRSLLEMLAAPLEQQFDESDERRALLQRLEELRSRLNWDFGRQQHLEAGPSRLPTADNALPERVRCLEREFLHLRRQLQLSSEPVGGSQRQSLPAGVPRPHDLQDLLGDEEQIVEYVTVRDDVMAFVIGRKQFVCLEGLASRGEVEQEMEALRYELSRPAAFGGGNRYLSQLCAAAQQPLRALHEMLLEPLAECLRRPQLTVIPHGILHGIPFHALYNGEAYALDRWEFAYAPSSAVWRACRLGDEPQGDESLLFGITAPGMAHVRDEVAGLRRALPDAAVFMDEAATLAAVPRQGAYCYLHFATHGIFRHDNPVFSGLQLADGWLVAADLYHRRLECRLATLSACRTGMGRVAPADELLGLARGFLHAGSQAVMASLWTADDAATAMLMQECYARLAAGMGRAAALRAAQQAVRRRYPHPYYWAAFSLIGSR
jgi:tetratricopeptide (TPR) repeat protein